MARLLPLLLIGIGILVAQSSCGDAPAKESGRDSLTRVALPAGKWNVEFTNGVIETCNIFSFDGDAHVTVDEPRRRARGTVTATAGSVVLTFHDDRVERWTPVGNRFIVEHWFPASRQLTVEPVLGIAERIP